MERNFFSPEVIVPGQAKLLKQLGIIQGLSYFDWFSVGGPILLSKEESGDDTSDIIGSAFTASEILVMLPQGTYADYNSEHDVWVLRYGQVKVFSFDTMAAALADRLVVMLQFGTIDLIECNRKFIEYKNRQTSNKYYDNI